MDPYAAQTYPPPPSSSQAQPPTQDPYLYNQQYNQPQHYQYYPQIPPQPQPQPQPQPPPSQHYPNAVYQQHPEQDHAAIHPPGVQIQADPNQIPAYQYGYAHTHLQNDPNSYYPQQQVGYSDPGVVQQGQQQPPPPWQQPVHTGDYGHASIYPPNGQAQYGSGSAGSGRGGGRPFRGGGSSARGRGRGRGRGGRPSIGQPPKAPCMAWCELCRVDCNTLEILENHKNGKKHKKNLKIQEDLQKLAAKSHEAQMGAAGNVENPPLTDGYKAAESEDPANGLKRKTRDGGGKSAEPSKKPKEIVPFICELCNVKCESAPTFDSHLKGKKHAFNLQVFQEQQATLGQAALQALYPALEALYPALLQALAQPNVNAFPANGGLDQQVLQWLQPFLPQTGPPVLPPGPESAPVAQGTVAQGGTAENQVGPTDKIDGAESKAADQVDPQSKVEEPDTKAAEPTELTK